MPIHFINCTEDSFKKDYRRLYRFITLNQLFKQLQSKKYPFVSPLKWNDPYEKYFIERSYRIKSKTYSFPFQKNIYALCLSSSANSEAFWNMYAPNSDGVRIGMNSDIFIFEFLKGIKDADVFVGPVKYYSTADFYKKEIDTKKLSKSFTNTDSIIHQVELLFRKRSAFSYENEVRVIIIPRRSRNGKEIIEFPIDFISNIFGISLDPRIGKNLFQFIKENLLKNYGIQISKASLYNKVKPSVWTIE
jgi:hypothetical protein